ncbi:hypothetical protein HD553DRAFT_338187 [Filobasidium floriforme]|uniref:uncharacterized protein n=1 Tax=Filobasidium floriforme TaxID=5210 RepID=UPI001E8E21F4|nr:uncharacterized protein HD553DRAFT_338187 [Filobasidium floriforme]KAH8090501.1 hypothetical protein HD553DRAFT_338187 [Filobasidium floriforme]
MPTPEEIADLTRKMATATSADLGALSQTLIAEVQKRSKQEEEEREKVKKAEEEREAVKLVGVAETIREWIPQQGPRGLMRAALARWDAQHPEYATTTTDEKAEKTVVPPLPQSPPPADSSSSGPSRERRASTPLREVLKAFVKAATTPKKRRVAVEEDDSDDVEYLREDGPSPKKAIKFAARRNARSAKGKGRANQVEECKARERPPTGIPLDRLTGRRNEARYG